MLNTNKRLIETRFFIIIQNKNNHVINYFATYLINSNNLKSILYKNMNLGKNSHLIE